MRQWRSSCWKVNLCVMAISCDSIRHLNYSRTISSSWNKKNKIGRKCSNRFDLRHQITKSALFMYVRKVNERKKEKKNMRQTVCQCVGIATIVCDSVACATLHDSLLRTHIILTARDWVSACVCVCVSVLFYIFFMSGEMHGAYIFHVFTIFFYFIFFDVFASLSESFGRSIENSQVCGYIVVVGISSVRLNTEE